MTSPCNGCGECCSVVIISANQQEAVRSARQAVAAGADPNDLGGVDPESYRWLLLDLTEISKERALEIRPALGENREEGETYHQCRHFDYASRRCLNYENRPPVCRRYPWYDRLPDARALACLPRCGYWAEVPFWSVAADGTIQVAELVEAA